eukprot:CAMPEP_0184650212 /NCGR_PEP_ID=MMETSP0308-20130426/7738_1 /TAXON_ID=38269 /ORGANISM="Gloeochaete witrockiana, Strain SAG 46.84" /LENGTH=644 /DNA_ID=CAMNT_0027083585 /DNA_START=229 /DNA_END=2160 /DNA_ORIENTATION=+
MSNGVPIQFVPHESGSVQVLVLDDKKGDIDTPSVSPSPPLSSSSSTAEDFSTGKYRVNSNKTVATSHLAFSDLKYSVSLSKGVQKQIIKGVSGVVKSGEILAILGPSGSGKSTLLDVVAGRKTTGTIEGDVRINGEIVLDSHHKSRMLYKYATSYVTQDDILLEFLSVRETLEYSAFLTLPKTMTRAQKLERVSDVIAQLGLFKAADTKVGGPFVRGVSGGERRRVSIGVELIKAPNILMLDEPTSGLSSADAYGVMEVLGGMARANHTIICTIHQPSHIIYSMFDKVMVLSQGNTAYFGPADRAVVHFESIGVSRPSGAMISTAEFLLDAVSAPMAVIGAEATEESQKRRLAEFDDRIDQYVQAFNKSESGVVLKEKMSAIRSGKASDVPPPLTKAMFDKGISVLMQIWILVRRAAILLARNPMTFAAILIQGVIFGVLVGSLLRGNAQPGQSEMLKYQSLFLMTMLVCYSFMSCVEALIAERAMMNRETTAGVYTLPAYFVSKTLISIPQYSVVLIPFLLIMLGFIGWNSTPAAIGYLILWTIVYSNVTASCTELFSALAPNASVAIIISNAIVGVSFMFGGFFVPKTLIPNYWIWLYYISFFTYGFSGVMVNEFTGREIAAGETNPLELFGLTSGLVSDKW